MKDRFDKKLVMAFTFHELKCKNIHPKSIPPMLPWHDRKTVDMWLDPTLQKVEELDYLLVLKIKEAMVVTPIDKHSKRKLLFVKFYLNVRFFNFLNRDLIKSLVRFLADICRSLCRSKCQLSHLNRRNIRCRFCSSLSLAEEIIYQSITLNNRNL